MKSDQINHEIQKRDLFLNWLFEKSSSTDISFTLRSIHLCHQAILRHQNLQEPYDNLLIMNVLLGLPVNKTVVIRSIVQSVMHFPKYSKFHKSQF